MQNFSSQPGRRPAVATTGNRAGNKQPNDYGDKALTKGPPKIPAGGGGQGAVSGMVKVSSGKSDAAVAQGPKLGQAKTRNAGHDPEKRDYFGGPGKGVMAQSSDRKAGHDPEGKRSPGMGKVGADSVAKASKIQEKDWGEPNSGKDKGHNPKHSAPSGGAVKSPAGFNEAGIKGGFA